MTDPTTTTTTEVALARALLELQGEVERLRELLDAKSHEAGLYARRMEQAQRSRDKARAEERAAVVAWLRAEVASATLYRVDDVSVDAASAGVAMLLAHVANVIESGKHRREERA